MFEPKYGVAAPTKAGAAATTSTTATNVPTETAASEKTPPPPPPKPESTSASASLAKTSSSTDKAGASTESNEMSTQVKVKEALVRNKLKEQLTRLKSETMRLNKVQGILGSLEAEQQADIDEIRRRIDEADRSLATTRYRFKRVEAEFKTAKASMEAKQTEKEALTEHLRLIIFNNESRKQEKLEALLKDLGLAEESTPNEGGSDYPSASDGTKGPKAPSGFAGF